MVVSNNNISEPIYLFRWVLFMCSHIKRWSVIMMPSSSRQAQAFDWFYRKPAWQKLRQMALSRDNGLCVRCYKENKIVKADVVHHIVYLADDIQKALQLENLESLCHSCHNKEHDEKPKRRKITREGLEFDDEGNLIQIEEMPT